jgi:arsenate reductase
MSDIGELDEIDAGDLLGRSVGVLAGDFVGVFGVETVERCVRDSYRHLAAGSGVAVWSAGTEPAVEVAPAVAEAMLEVGIDLASAFPKPLTDEVFEAADVVVTMGCGEACPVLPGRRYEDWLLAHPVGDTVEQARSARDEIRERVEALLASMLVVTS